MLFFIDSQFQDKQKIIIIPVESKDYGTLKIAKKDGFLCWF